MGNVDELTQAQAMAARVACDGTTSSRRRMLARLGAGDGEGATCEMEHHLWILHSTGRLAGHPAQAAWANRAWVRNTLWRKDREFAELLDRVLFN
jgi:hypothetical protein